MTKPDIKKIAEEIVTYLAWAWQYKSQEDPTPKVEEMLRKHIALPATPKEENNG